jgi:hypothetical protein
LDSRIMEKNGILNYYEKIHIFKLIV